MIILNKYKENQLLEIVKKGSNFYCGENLFKVFRIIVKFSYIHTVKNLYILSLLLLITSCTLNSEQEASLSKATKEYIDSRNEGILITYAAYTHPNVLKFYLDQGHDAFKKRFKRTTGENTTNLRNGNIRYTEVSGKNIHVKYDYVGMNNFSYRGRRARKVSIYALSSDDGKSWHFIDGTDYWNDKIISSKNRLIKER